MTELTFYRQKGTDYYYLAIETPMGNMPIMFFPCLESIKDLSDFALRYYNRQRAPIPDVFEREFGNGQEEK